MKQVAREDARTGGRPHVLAIPYPLTGHMTPIVQLCRMLIAETGCRVTLACLERYVPSLRRLLVAGKLLQEEEEEEAGELNHVHVTVLPISDGLPLEPGPFTWDRFRRVLPALQEGLARGFEPHISRFSRDDGVVCVVSDVYLSWTQDVADQLGVPRLAVWVAAAAEFQVYFHAQDLVKTGKLPFKTPNGSERGIDNMLPTMPGRPPLYHRVDGQAQEEEEIKLCGLPALNRRDFPTFLQIEDSSEILFYFFIEHVKTSVRASMVLFNTFEALDGILLDAMRSQGVLAQSIGPLFLLEDVMNEHVPLIEGRNENANWVNQECLQWLDEQRTTSVMYVAFGTLIRLEKAQVRELALGLLNSSQPFLWVYPNLTKDGVEGGESELPEGFLNKVKGRGLVLEWVPQKQVLSHPSIGGFLSHCGWNSTMEAMCCGVPILGLPFVSDQPLHCKMIVDEWKFGLRLERRPDVGIAVADDISCLTKELLVGERGKQLRKQAQELKMAATNSIQNGVSSRLKLDAIVRLVKKS